VSEPTLAESLTRSTATFTRLSWMAVLVVLGVPCIQMSFGPAWMYTPSSIDAWVYHGYFLHLQHHAIVFNGTYYGTRLAWILPGYLAHHFFTPLIANAILRLFLYWTAAISTVFLVRRSYGERCALITSLLLCAFGGFLASIGWDYVDGAGISYSLLCLEELSAAATQFNNRSSTAAWRSLMAGSAFAAAVHSNIILLCFTPMMALFFLVRTGWRGLVMAFPAAVGFGTLTAFLGFISVRLGGPFLFFMPSVQFGPALWKRNPWYIDGLRWMVHAWWLAIPSAACLLSLALVIKLRRRSVDGIRDADYAMRFGDAACFLLAFASFVTLAAIRNPILQLPFYTSYLTIFVVVATGAFLGRRFDSWKIASFLGLTACCTLLSLIIGTGLAPRILYASRLFPVWYLTLGGAPEIALGLLFAIGVLVSEWIKQRALSTVIASGCVAALLLHIGIGTRQGARDLYLDVSRTSRNVGDLTGKKPVWFWYDEPSDVDGRCESIAATYLWGYRLLSRHLPDATKFSLQTVFPGNYIAVLDRRPGALTGALEALQHDGLKLGAVTSLTSPTAASNYTVDLVQVTSVSDPAPPPPASLPAKHLTRVVTVLKYDLSGLRQHTIHTVYGHPASSVAVELPFGVFRVTDARDHFATEFRNVPQDGSMHIAGLQLLVSDSTAEGQFGPPVMILQDDGYRTIYASDAVPNGHKEAFVALPAGTRAIRIAFLGNREGFIRFPSSVEVDGVSDK
jgi:hypothetical protein